MFENQYRKMEPSSPALQRQPVARDSPPELVHMLVGVGQPPHGLHE